MCFLAWRLAFSLFHSWESLQDRDADPLAVRAPDRVFGAALAVGRDQGEHFIGRVHDLLIAGVKAPRLLALALRAVEVGTENLSCETAPQRRLFCPRVRAGCSARYDHGIRRKIGHEPVNRLLIGSAPRTDDCDVSQEETGPTVLMHSCRDSCRAWIYPSRSSFPYAAWEVC